VTVVSPFCFRCSVARGQRILIFPTRSCRHGLRDTNFNSQKKWADRMTGDLFQVVSRREDTTLKIPRDASDAGPHHHACLSWSWQASLGVGTLTTVGEVCHRNSSVGEWWRSGLCSHVCGPASPALPVIVHSHARTAKSGGGPADEPIYHFRILSIHPPRPLFCDVILVGELNY
jgi:hypothetical protein